VGREANSATDQAAAEDISAEAIVLSQEPIDQYVVVSTLVQISAALDYWNGGMDKMFVIEYDRQNHVVQDKYGNRLHVSISAWKDTLRLVHDRVQTVEPEGLVIRATGYERYDPSSETLIQ